MVSTITINPNNTTVASGSFNVSSEGFIQGTMLDDPAIRNQLAGGYLATTETLPMWGGVGVNLGIPGAAGTPLPNLGPSVARATTISATGAAGALQGFSVFNQDHAMINSPQSPVPLAASGMLVNFFRLGSGARIIVACDPALASLESSPETQQVSWDFGAQQLSPFQAAWNAATITNATWSAGQATFTTSAPHGISVGSDITVTGVVPAGYNGFFKTVAGTTGSTIVVNLAVNPGAYVSGGSVPAGGGAVPVKVLDFQFGNSMTVSLDPTTNFATWNRAGNVAVILI